MFLAASVVLNSTGTAQEADPRRSNASPTVRYARFDTQSGAAVHLVVFDPSRYTLRVIGNGTRAERPKFRNLADAMQRNGCVAGINGGFFDTEHFTPCGLMIASGSKVSSFDPKGWQEGVLVVRGDEISLVERDAFMARDDVTAGLQSSPWLIRSGRIEEVQKRDERRARRAFVATGKSSLRAIGFSTPMTFYELAETLASEPVSKIIEFGEVLALDGATSAGFWCDVDGQRVSDPELVTVRNFVAVVPKGAATDALRVNRTSLLLAVLVVVIAAVLRFWRSQVLRGASSAT